MESYLMRERIALLSRIQKVGDELKLKRNFLLRSQQSHTMQFERIVWKQENLRDLKQQESQTKEISHQLKYSHQKTKKSEIILVKQILNNILNQEQHGKEFLEFVFKFFEHQIRLQSLRIHPRADEGYINPLPSIKLKCDIKQLSTIEIETFIVDEETKISQLKEVAINYWGLGSNIYDGVEKFNFIKQIQICEHTYALIDQEEKIIQFYRQRGIADFSRFILILCMKNEINENFDAVQKAGTKLYRGELQLDRILAHKNIMNTKDPYEVFFERFPGLKYFIDEKDVANQSRMQELDLRNNVKAKEVAANTEENYKQSLIAFDDTHCCVLTCMMSIFVLTWAQFYAFLPSEHAQPFVNSIEGFIGIQDENSVWFEIEQESDFWSYLSQNIAKNFFNSESKVNFFRQNNELIGNVRLRQLRQTINDCPRYVHRIQEHSCFRYSERPTNTNQIGIGHRSWQHFRDSSYLKTTNPSYGEILTYGGDGFVRDFHKDISYETFNQMIDEMDEYIDSFTQVLFIQFTTYSPARNIWLYVMLILERDASNRFVPNEPQLAVFTPNLYEGRPQAFIIDIIRLALGFVQLSIVVYRFRQENYRMTYITLEVGALHLASSLTCAASVCLALIQTKNQYSSFNIVNSDSYIDFYEESLYYGLTYLMLSTSNIFILMRMILLFKYSDTMKLIFQGWEKAKLQIMIFILLVIPLLTGFQFAFQNIYGPYMKKFSRNETMLAQLLNMLFASIDIMQFIYVAGQVTMFNVIFFYLFSMYFIQFAYKGLLIESFRQSIMQHGYQSTQKMKFSYKIILYWVFSWVFKILPNIQQDKEHENLEINKVENNYLDELQITENDQLSQLIIGETLKNK